MKRWRWRGKARYSELGFTTVTIPDIAGSVLLESPDVSEVATVMLPEAAGRMMFRHSDASEVRIELPPVSQVRPGRLKKIGALLQHRGA